MNTLELTPHQSESKPDADELAMLGEWAGDMAVTAEIEIDLPSFYDGMFDDEPGTNREIDPTVLDDQLASYFVNPEAAASAREWDGVPPVDMAEFTAWVNDLPKARRQELETTRQDIQENNNLINAVHDKLTATVPELYQAKLPSALESRLDGRQYALGFNQSAASTVKDAKTTLNEDSGVDTTNYGLHERFLMFDSSMDFDGEALLGINRAIDSGYTNKASVGRFVVAFPVEQGADVSGDRLATVVSTRPEVLPADLEVRTTGANGENHTSVSSKYVAGFIDGAGTFWANQGFGISDEAQFQQFDTANK